MCLARIKAFFDGGPFSIICAALFQSHSRSKYVFLLLPNSVYCTEYVLF